ncbi:hypothetical protein BJX76DRAFT_292062 [Aspergillus varians]
MNLRSLFRKRESSVYGLDHAILNIPIPPPSMWMNLGYWKDTSDFPTACAALLDQVLITAGLLNENGDPTSHSPEKLRLLDVGIGCGDQSVRILGYKRGGDGNGNGNGNESPLPLFNSYVGITSLPIQAEFASQRISSKAESDSESKSEPNQHARIFCADAANPPSWPPELRSSVTPFQDADANPGASGKGPTEAEKEKEIETENWLLALDTLYHFHPSRGPLLKYTHSTLHASLMAFDLLLQSPSSSSSKQISLWTRLLLRLLCLLSGTPYSNFLTEEEYTALLVRSGYEAEKIVFRDISADVFPGIAGFIKRRGEVVKGYGLGGGSMGKFRGAGAVFGWWARTGVVKGVVVVARV